MKLPEVPPELVEIAVHCLAEQLILVFNVSFQEVIIPDKLKVGAICSIHKNDSKSACSNYRPTSILPFLSEIFVKLTYQRIMENAILDLYSNVIKALVDLEKPRRLFLDFAKAIWLIMIYY